jgi:hypothetical protein
MMKKGSEHSCSCLCWYLPSCMSPPILAFSTSGEQIHWRSSHTHTIIRCKALTCYITIDIKTIRLLSWIYFPFISSFGAACVIMQMGSRKNHLYYHYTSISKSFAPKQPKFDELGRIFAHPRFEEPFHFYESFHRNKETCVRISPLSLCCTAHLGCPVSVAV